MGGNYLRKYGKWESKEDYSLIIAQGFHGTEYAWNAELEI